MKSPALALFSILVAAHPAHAGAFKALAKALHGTWELGCTEYGQGSLNQQTTFLRKGDGETITVIYSGQDCDPSTESSRLQQGMRYQVSADTKKSIIVTYQHTEVTNHSVANDRLRVTFSDDRNTATVSMLSGVVYRGGEKVALTEEELQKNVTVTTRVADPARVIQHR